MDLFRGYGVEIKLSNPVDFLKVKETLTRIGVPSGKEKILYQSCHILHKQGRYAIIHFKELYALDGKPSSFTHEDEGRRNTIAYLLAEWGLVTIVGQRSNNAVPINQIKILNFQEKNDWQLEPKYKFWEKKK